MEVSVGVVLADSSGGFRQLLGELIDEEENMYVAGSADNGLEAMEIIEKLRPTVLITDLLLREMEGLELLRRLKAAGIMPRTAVVSGFFNDSMAKKVSELGAELYLPKPFRVESILEFIRECGGETPAKVLREVHTDERVRLVEELLSRCGVMPHLSGRKYLREALLRILEDEEKLLGVTKVLYPEVARCFGITAVSVERCIRNALDLAWRDGNAAEREEYFGESYAASLRERPGNVRFMKLAAELIARRMKESK